MKKLLLSLCFSLFASTGISAEKIFDQTFTARNFNSSPLTISDLAGDTYDYSVIIKTMSASATASEFQMLCNNESGASDYRVYLMRGYSSTTNAIVDDTRSYIPVGYTKDSTVSFSINTITGSSGNERYISTMFSGDNGDYEVRKESCFWNDTVNELSSLVFKSSASINTDAHIIVYRNLKGSSQGRWEWLEKKTISSQDVLSPYTLFSSLSLDSHGKYRIDFNILETTTSDLGFLLNNDNSSNTYYQQRLRNAGGSISAIGSDDENILLGDTGDSAELQGSIFIQGSSGNKRLCYLVLGQTKAHQQHDSTIWWSNTADDLSSIQIKKFGVSGSTNTTATFNLYRQSQGYKVGDLLPFRVHETVSVSGDFSAGHTFTGLRGDDYKLIKIEFTGSEPAASSARFRIQINNDSTAGNYQIQQLRSQGSSALAFVNSSDGNMARLHTAGNFGFTSYIYTQSGDKRPALTVGYRDDYTLEYSAGEWSDTANPITSVKVFSDSTNSITGTLKLSILR